MFYQVPGNTQKKSARAIPTATDPHCVSAIGSDECDDIEILAILESKDPKEGEGDSVTAKKEQEIKVRTLGGMRLRYRYIPPSLPGLKMTKVTWKINHLGRYCKKYGVEDAGDCEEREANVEFEQKQPNAIAENIDEVGDWSIYWEPLTKVTRNNAEVKEVDWSNWAGTNTDDAGVTANLNAEYTVPVTTVDSYGNSTSNPDGVTRYYKSDFTLHTRELKPISAPAKPMQGSDVAMLEAMLWELGLSPQHPYTIDGALNGVGKTGVRIGTNSSDLNGVVGGEFGKNTFSVGMSGASGSGSMERMVKRYKARSTAVPGVAFGLYAGTAPDNDGVVDDAFLTSLGYSWGQAFDAYSNHKNDGAIDFNFPSMNQWLQEALNLWANGDADHNVSATYTDAIHQSALASAGVTGTQYTRLKLLKDWKQQEGGRHWGRGVPTTKFRIYEGAADEVGSIGFSQIQWATRYGQPSMRCTGLDHLNLYDPRDAVLGIITFVASTVANCGGGFDLAFGQGTWDTIQQGANGPRAYFQGTIASTAPTAINNTDVDDDYALLMKAIAHYNGQLGTNNTTWANMLKTTHTLAMGKGYSNRTYAIQIMRRYGVGARTYIWYGGVEPDNIPLFDENGLVLNPDGTPQTVANPQAGQEWCFRYGETEWLAAQNWDVVRASANYYSARGMPQSPVGHIACP